MILSSLMNVKGESDKISDTLGVISFFLFGFLNMATPVNSPIQVLTRLDPLNFWDETISDEIRRIQGGMAVDHTC